MASTDARPVPIKNTAFRAVFPILDADGDLVTGAASLDSEVSLDQGTFADCTNEATEIATASGLYYLDLTAAEMNADAVAVIVKTGTAGAKTTVLVFYPEEAGDINVDVTAFGGTAGTFASGRPEVNTTHAAGTAWGSGAITAASIAADAITDAKVASDVTIASVTGAVGSVTAGVTVTTNNDKTGYALSTAGIQAVWDALTSALTTVGSIGKWILDKLDVAVSTRGTGAALDAAGVRSAVGLASANLDTQLDALPTATETADQVWNEAIADHLSAGSTGAALNAAGSAGDPWTTPLPGVYGAGTAGKIVGDNLNATVSSRATQTSVDTIDDLLDSEVAAIKAKTDNLPASPAATGDIPSAATIADAVWDEATTGHVTSGTFGEQATTDIDAILADTGTDGVVLGAGAITAAVIATDAIDADALATDAVTELQSGLSTLTAAGVRTAVGLASANLDTQLAAIAAYLDTEIAAILAAVDTEVGAVKTVTDQLVATQAEPSAVPAANATPLAKIAWLAALARNRVTQTATTQTVYADDGSTPIATSTVSDDATTYVRGEFV